MAPLSQNVTELIEAYLQGPPCLQKLTEPRRACLHGPHHLQKVTELRGACLYGPHCLQLYHHHWSSLKDQKRTSLSLILMDDLPSF